MAIAVIAPLTTERGIEIPAWQPLIVRQHVDGFEQQGVEATGVPPGFLASVVAAKNGWCI